MRTTSKARESSIVVGRKTLGIYWSGETILIRGKNERHKKGA